METERDIRLLTLQKQHYLDKYTEPLNSRFSCLGYYDGMDIREVKNEKYSQLFNKQTASPISELWFCAGQITEELKGGYSCQNIGMFRCVPKNNVEARNYASEFWKNIDNVPYFSVGFIKLKDGREYEKVAENIEEEVNTVADTCRALTYCTYDNADLVVLLQANSVSQMTAHLRAIEYNDNVIYFHSIMSFSEDYLRECATGKKIQKTYKGKDCGIDDKIDRISVRFATNGSKEMWGKIKKELGRWVHDQENGFSIENYEKITWAYTLGHGNVQVDIPDTNIRTLLTLLLPKGFLTHQNELYGSCIYNIETYLQVERKEWEEVGEVITDKEEEQKQGEKKKSWCVTLMNKYQDEMKELLDRGEDGLYSHFQALIQTLNTLDQYERFRMSREMFCLLYPSLQMFANQLEGVLQKRKKIYFDEAAYYLNIERVKNSLEEMIEYVNSVIYHTVHTDQVYLMIPGYSGSSFSIPIKLNLLYLWFIQRIIDILNDSFDNTYTAILIPVSESRPMTSINPLDVEERNRLIRVKISQRFLFMPRPLIIFLCHEIAHYVGDRIRERKLRKECMVNVMARCIAEGMCAGIEDILVSDEYVKEWGIETKKNLTEEFKSYVEGSDNSQDEKENCYGETVKVFLKRMAWSFLSSSDEAVEIIGQIPAKYCDAVNDQKFINRMRTLYEVQQQMENNRREMLATGTIDLMVDWIMALFQEVFCDTAAYGLLRFSLEDFDEAFRISEGMQIPDIKELPTQGEIRYRMMKKLIRKNQQQINQTKTKEEEPEREVVLYRDIRSLYEHFLANFYNFEGIESELYHYMMQCFDKIKEHFEKEKNNGGDLCRFGDNRKKIEEGFQLFKHQSEQNQRSCNEIYKVINARIYEYIEETEKMISGDDNKARKNS